MKFSFLQFANVWVACLLAQEYFQLAQKQKI